MGTPLTNKESITAILGPTGYENFHRLMRATLGAEIIKLYHDELEKKGINTKILLEGIFSEDSAVSDFNIDVLTNLIK